MAKCTPSTVRAWNFDQTRNKQMAKYVFFDSHVLARRIRQGAAQMGGHPGPVTKNAKDARDRNSLVDTSQVAATSASQLLLPRQQ